jgi:tetratricopeptide (TPR) repeat protein
MNPPNLFKNLIIQSVVRIQADSSTGTGFFITKDGYIVTAWHVANELTQNITVELYDKTELEATFDSNKSDKRFDIAVLKVNLTNNITCLPLASEKTLFEFGDTIATFGYAGDDLAYINGGYFEGKISNIDDKRIYIDNLAKGRGNSGAPVFHIQTGRVVGVISSLIQSEIVQGAGHAKHITSLLEKWSELATLTEEVAREVEQKLDFIPKYLTNIYTVNKNDIVGRDKELKEIYTKLEISKCLVINGMGGIGKTVLAKLFLNTYKHKFQQILWLDVTSTTIGAFVENSLLIYNLNINFKEDEEELVKFQIILNKLLSLEGRNLLILDNAENDGIYKAIEPLFANWHILITSREKLLGIDTREQLFKLEELKKDDAKKLFLKNYREENIDAGQLVKLLKLVDYHTLTIELISKLLEEDAFLSIEELITHLEKNQIHHDELQETKISSKYNPSEKEIFTHLRSLFKLNNKLNAEQKRFLLYFSVMPSVDIYRDDLIEYLKIDRKAFNTLNTLVKMGWLQSKSKGYFKLHKLMQDVIRYELIPTVSNCRTLVESFSELFLVQVGKNPLKKVDLIPYGESLSSFIMDEDALVADFLDNFAKTLRYFAYNDEAIEYALRALSIREKILPPNHNSFGRSYTNISVIYRYLSKYNEALEYGEKALKFFSEKKDFVGIATAYFKKTLIYIELGKYEEALKLNNKDIKALTQGLECGHAYFAESFNVRGEIYRHLKEYYKSIKWKKKALTIRENVLESDHPDLAISYHDMALSYVNIEDFGNAKVFVNKAIEIREKFLPDNHRDLLDSSRLRVKIEQKL